MRAVDFKQYILERFFQDIRQVQRDNYSAERFSYDGVDRSADFDAATRASYLDWFVTEHTSIFDAYSHLADQESRNLYIDLLRFKLAGHQHVRINTPVRHRSAETAAFQKVFAGTESTVNVGGMFGDLRHYDGVWENTRYTVDTIKNSLAATLVNRQYYFERHGVTIGPEPGDYCIDGGACTGDTSVVFSRSVGPEGKVYAFDPVQTHVDVCRLNFSRPDLANVEILPYGLSDRSVDAQPVTLDTYSPGFRVADDNVPLVRIDDLVIDGRIKRIDFIKLDIEGSELAALRGACSSIHRFKPKLAISIYHKPADFFQIYQYVNGLNLGYTFYLDHYTIWDEETVLYAVCDRRHEPPSGGVALLASPEKSIAIPEGAAPDTTTLLTALGHIDEIHVLDNGALLSIRGWAVITEDPACATGVYLKIDGAAPVEAFAGLERPDVADAFKNSGFATCGFRAILSTVAIAPGVHFVTLMVRDSVGYFIEAGARANFSIGGPM